MDLVNLIYFNIDTLESNLNRITLTNILKSGYMIFWKKSALFIKKKYLKWFKNTFPQIIKISVTYSFGNMVNLTTLRCFLVIC